jgi:hypothetical protein
MRRASASFRGSTSHGDHLRGAFRAEHLHDQHADHARTDDDGGVIRRGDMTADPVHRHGDRLEERCALERQAVGQLVNNPGRHRHVFREGAVTPILAGGHAEHRAVVAQVDPPAPAEVAGAARHRRIERHSIARLEASDAGADPFDHAGGLVPHHQWRDAPSGRAVVPVDVAAADAARPHPHQHLAVADVGHRHVDDRQFLVLGEEQRSHRERGGASDQQPCSIRCIRVRLLLARNSIY